MKFNFLLIVALTALFSAPSQAGIVTWSDNSGEVVYHSDGSLNTSGTIVVGDIFVGIAEINQHPFYTGTGEVSGVFAASVLSITAQPSLTSQCGGLPSCSSFSFTSINSLNSSFTGFANAVNTILGTNLSLLSNSDNNTLIEFLGNTTGTPPPMLESPQNYNQAANVNFLNASTEQILVMGTGVGTSWTAFGPSSLIEIAGALPPLQIGNFTVNGGNLSYQNSALLSGIFGPVVSAGGTIFTQGPGALAAGDYLITDQTNFNFSRTTSVPEPSTLALIGIGLLFGFAVSKRKRVDMAMYA